MNDVYLFGKVIDLDVVNLNNRIYPKDVVIPAVHEYNTKSDKLSEVMPLERNSVIDLDNVGALCEELVIHENTVYAKMRVLPTLKGKNLILTLSENANIMLSLRANAKPSRLENGVVQINELKIISIDVLPFDGRDTDTICEVTFM